MKSQPSFQLSSFASRARDVFKATMLRLSRFIPIPSPLTPTSDRPEARVYAPGQPAVSAPAVPPPAVRDSDVRLGQTISNLLKGDPHLADASGNVIATIENGVVTLDGKVPTEHDRYEIVERVSKLPGVAHVNDHLGIEGER